MTIEINRAGSAYIYRICPTDPSIIERRVNKHNARWQKLSTFDTPARAQRALLQLEKKEQATD